jgi:hypothetical protein
MSGLLSDHKQHFQFELINNEYEKVNNCTSFAQYNSTQWPHTHNSMLQ